MTKFCLEIGVPLKSLKNVVTKAEELEFDAVFYGDSLGRYQLECWTALAIISSYTKSIRLGPAVTFPLIRHPSILARTAATIDQFSNGRLEFRVGLGGKTMKADSEKYGFVFRKYSERVKILDESLQIIKGLWTNNEINFNGEYFKLNNAHQEIVPIQKNGPPITISGKSDGILELLGKHGDVWESDGKHDSDYPALVKKVDGVCSKYNKTNIDKSIELFVSIDTRNNISDGSSNGIKKDWNFLVGDTGVVCGKIQELIDVGFNRYTIYFFNRKDNRFEQDEVILIKQMEVFKDNVIPGLKF